jgi:hypothetical protein
MGGDPPTPPVDAAEHLIGYWRECGTVESGGFGALPLSYQVIEAWQRCTGISLSAWEATTIRAMSAAYCRGLSDGEDSAAPPPWIDGERDGVGDKIKAIFGAKARGGK